MNQLIPNEDIDITYRVYITKSSGGWLGWSKVSGDRGCYKSLDSAKRSIRALSVFELNHEIWKFHIGIPGISNVPYFIPTKVFP